MCLCVNTPPFQSFLCLRPSHPCLNKSDRVMDVLLCWWQHSSRQLVITPGWKVTRLALLPTTSNWLFIHPFFYFSIAWVLTHQSKCQLSIPPLTLLQFLQPAISVSSEFTNPLWILSSPLSPHLLFCIKFPPNSTLCAKQHYICPYFCRSTSLLCHNLNSQFSIFLCFSPSPEPQQLSCILLETDKKNISRYKSIDGVTLWGCSWGLIALL